MGGLVLSRASDFLGASVALIRAHAPRDGSGSRSVPGWFRGAVRGLVAAGVFDREQAAGWHERARVALAGAGGPVRPSRGLLARARRLAADGGPGWDQTELRGLLGELGLDVDFREPERRWWLPAPAFGEPVVFCAGELERVIVPGPVEGPVQLDSVCLYGDGVVVSVSGPARRAGDELADQVTVWWVMDDVGTEYRRVGGGGNSGNGWPQGATPFFAPALPKRAKRLFVGFGALEVEVGLADG